MGSPFAISERPHYRSRGKTRSIITGNEREDSPRDAARARGDGKEARGHHPMTPLGTMRKAPAARHYRGQLKCYASSTLIIEAMRKAPAMCSCRGQFRHYRSALISEATAARNLAAERSHSIGMAFLLLTDPHLLPLRNQPESQLRNLSPRVQRKKVRLRSEHSRRGSE